MEEKLRAAEKAKHKPTITNAPPPSKQPAEAPAVAQAPPTFAPAKPVSSVKSVTPVKSGSSQDEGEAAVMFGEIDKNTDGRLTHGELKKFIKKQSWARKLTGSDGFHWKDFFAQYDGVSDGYMSQAAFATLYYERIQPIVNPPSTTTTTTNVPVHPKSSNAQAEDWDAAPDDPDIPAMDDSRPLSERSDRFARLQAMADGTPVKPQSESSLSRAKALEERLAKMAGKKK